MCWNVGGKEWGLAKRVPPGTTERFDWRDEVSESVTSPRSVCGVTGGNAGSTERVDFPRSPLGCAGTLAAENGDLRSALVSSY
jgi:hypothetical protein